MKEILTISKMTLIGLALFISLRGKKKQAKSKSVEGKKEGKKEEKKEEKKERSYPSYKKQEWMHLKSNAERLIDIELEEKSYIKILNALIGYSEWLQNDPPAFVPREELAADTVIDYLKPWSQESQGPLKIRKIKYTEGRAHVIIQYEAAKKTDKIVSFVGSHMDVVTANKNEWKRNPFNLIKEGDVLYGRGVTDCLGHVALFCNFFKQLAQVKPDLKINVAAVFICDEENGKNKNIGIFELEKQGELEFLKHGPVYWVDASDFGPTMGTGAMQQWKLEVTGKKCHSGMPKNGINPINLGMSALQYLQTRFYEDFPMLAQGQQYKFKNGSSLKPTQISVPKGSLNQIPNCCTIQGDVRMTPFYDISHMKETVNRYVSDFESKMSTLHIKGGYGRYICPDEGNPKEEIRGKLEMIWVGEPYQGIACKLDSIGFITLNDAIKKIRGESKPFSLTGSLPVVKDLQDSGFDVQITGFGKHEAYHAIDEFGLLKDFKDGCKIVSYIVNVLNDSL